LLKDEKDRNPNSIDIYNKLIKKYNISFIKIVNWHNFKILETDKWLHIHQDSLSDEYYGIFSNTNLDTIKFKRQEYEL
jgi:hypothetical protein